MQLLRIVRIVRRLRARRYIGPLAVLSVLAVAILGNAACFYYFEQPGRMAATPPDPLTAEDTIWYSIISITTIGYGDFYATTTGARVSTFVFIVVVGLGAFSMIVGMTIDTLTGIVESRRRGMANILTHDHIIIVNAPTTDRLNQLISELKADPNHQSTDIVVVSDRIEELPFQDAHVLFVRGSVLARDTYERACVGEANKAIVLATSYDDPGSDAVVASAVAVIDSIKPDIHIVAECINPSHRPLFDSVHCDSIVFSMGITGNLLAQEAQDPGIAQLIEVITSNSRGTTLFSTDVAEGSTEDYTEMARQLLAKDINVLCVNRGQDSLTSWQNTTPQSGDRLIYAAGERHSWSELKSLATG